MRTALERQFPALLAFIALLVAAAGCGGSSGPLGDGGTVGQGVCTQAVAGSCSQTVGGKTYCVDYRGPSGGTFVSACQSTGGTTGSTNPCTHQNAIGGCQVPLNQTLCSTTWAYAPDTEEQNRQSC